MSSDGLELIPENIPDTGFPEGYVNAANNPAEPPLQHRPHAFALMHGDGGAKIAYGQFMWRVDVIDFHFTQESSGSGSGILPSDAVGQDVIDGVNVVIPTLNDFSGDAMDPTIPNIYHQLDGYGDVYLVWHAELGESEILTECCVEVVAEGETGIAIVDAASVAAGAATLNRFTGVGTSSGQQSGMYRVKLGTVNEDDLITQDISSDVYWSFFLIERVLLT